MSTIDRFLELSTERRHLLIEAAFRLIIARLQTSTRPFRRISPSLGSIANASTVLLSEAQEATANDISWAIDCAARHLPGTLLCLPRAIAAKRMLAYRKIPATLYLGTRRSKDNNLTAHAWLRSGSVKVTGGDGATSYTTISYFS